MVVFVFVAYLCCPVSNFQFIFFIELFLVTSEVAHTRGSHDTSYITILNIVKIFFKRKTYFSLTFVYRKHFIKKFNALFCINSKY